MVQYDEYGNVIDDVRKYPAKAAVAQGKPRDATGRFLSGERLQEYQIQQQSMQQQAERDKINQILGRSGIGGMGSIQPSTLPGNDNFAAILAANKPGSGNDEKLAILLGKKRRVI